MADHALLSASSSHRWLHCPPSAKLSESIPDHSTSYAAEGTDAHTLCAYLVEKALGCEVKDPIEDLRYYNAEMQNCAEEYCSYVLEQLEAAKTACPDPVVFVEQRLNYSRWVPDGFGTGDCVIVADSVLQIIDYKHGVGVEVSADHNSQMMCYALGALETYDGLYDIREIRMTIFQPRKANVSEWSINKGDLLKWADEVLKPTAELAYKGAGEQQAGAWCRFCKIRRTCRKRAEANLSLAQHEFKLPPILSDEEVTVILGKLDDLTNWASDIREYALDAALKGARFEGWKLVEGRANRRFTDEAAVAKAVTANGYDPYEHKLIGITAMEKMLGKKNFATMLGNLVERPQGKPTLVPENDKRPELTNPKNDFDDN